MISLFFFAILLWLFIKFVPFKAVRFALWVVFYYMLIIVIIWGFSGCAQAERVRTEYIQVPTYCKVKMPPKPSLETQLANIVSYETFLSNLKEMLIYTDKLEMALTCCTNSSDCITNTP